MPRSILLPSCQPPSVSERLHLFNRECDSAEHCCNEEGSTYFDSMLLEQACSYGYPGKSLAGVVRNAWAVRTFVTTRHENSTNSTGQRHELISMHVQGNDTVQ